MKPIKNVVRKQEGELARLLCLEYKFVNRMSVHWTKNGVIQARPGRYNFNNEFVLAPVRFKDSGIYECVVNGQILVSIELVVSSNASQVDALIEQGYVDNQVTLVSALAMITGLMLFSLVMGLLNELFINKNVQLIQVSRNKLTDNVRFYVKANLECLERRFAIMVENEYDFKKIEDDDENGEDKHEDCCVNSDDVADNAKGVYETSESSFSQSGSSESVYYDREVELESCKQKN